jgi:hypothetical protein
MARRFRAYYDRQIPVTGRQYQRIALGPAPVEMPPLINELLRDELLEIKPTDVGGFIEKRHIALADPVTNLFSREDLDYLDEAITHYWGMTGAETSDESHGVCMENAGKWRPNAISNVVFRRCAAVK